MQVQVQKALSQFDFLTTTMYERYDLTNLIKPNERFVVRQGDLIVTNYPIENHRQKGLRYAWTMRKDSIYKFMGSHIVISQENQTLLIHPEHGIVVIPKNFNELEFYTFADAGD
jgi:hypothetical protein